MSRANLDLLFQVTSGAGHPSASPRRDELAPAFGDHLSHASAPALEAPKSSSRRDDSHAKPTSAAETSERSNSTRNNSPAGASSAESTSGSRDQAQQDDHVSTPEQSSSAKSSPDEAANSSAKRKDESKDKNDDELAAEVGYAANAALSSTKNELHKNAAVESSAEDGELELENGERATGNGANASDADPRLKTLKTKTKVANDADLAEGETIDAVSDNESTGEAANSGKKAHSESSLDKAGDGVRVAGGGVAKEGRAPEATESVVTSVETTGLEGEMTSDAKADAEAASLSGSDSDKLSRDESGRAASRQRSNADATTNKLTVTAVANNNAAPLPDRSATTEGASSANGARPTASKPGIIAEAAAKLHGQVGRKQIAALEGGDEAPRIDPARFVGRVTKAFHAAQERGGALQIRLSPPELGAMRLELSVKDGVMSASLETENASAKKVLLEHLPVLRDRLAEQNIRIDRFDVDVRRDSTGGQADPRASQDQQQSPQNHSERRQPVAPQRAAAPALTPATTPPAATTSTGINLVA